MEIVQIIIIFGAGFITGMYIVAQIEGKIDKDLKNKKTKAKNQTK